jgi:hypothetical protein
MESLADAPIRSHAFSAARGDVLERNGLPRAAPTKLSLDAPRDLIALAEESGGACPSNLDGFGAACRKHSGKRSQKISAKSCGRCAMGSELAKPDHERKAVVYVRQSTHTK